MSIHLICAECNHIAEYEDGDVTSLDYTCPECGSNDVERGFRCAHCDDIAAVSEDDDNALCETCQRITKREFKALMDEFSAAQLEYIRSALIA